MYSFVVASNTEVRMTGMLFILSSLYDILDTYKLLQKHKC